MQATKSFLWLLRSYLNNNKRLKAFEYLSTLYLLRIVIIQYKSLNKRLAIRS